MASRVALLILATTAVMLLSGCQSWQQDDSLARVQASGKLVIGVDPSYPPFATLNAKGQPEGYEIDLAAEIARRLGVTPSFTGMDIGGIIDALIARKIDVIISGIEPDPEYTKQIAYSRPYFNAGQVLVIKPGGPSTIAALAGRTVGVESGSTGDLEIRKLAGQVNNMHVKSYTTAQAAMDDVRAGSIDAAATDVVTAKQYLQQNPGLTIGGPPFTDEFYVVATRRADDSLLTAINKTLDDLDREGFLKNLEQKWIR